VAHNSKTYTPGVEKVTVGLNGCGFVNVTVPGPEVTFHEVLTVPGGLGFPSSSTVPLCVAGLPNWIVCVVPALTEGGRLAMVGVGEGVKVGVLVGFAVGVSVGVSVGTVVGTPVGVALGFGVFVGMGVWVGS